MLQLGADRIIADNVVVATGTFGRTPRIPDFALDLDPSIRQLHSSEYRRPSQLKPGRVLVVGAAHSGSDIAFEVAATHPTVLAGRDTGQVPVPLDQLDGPAGLSCRRLPRQPCAHPADTDGPQSSRGGPVPWRTECTGSSVPI